MVASTNIFRGKYTSAKRPTIKNVCLPYDKESILKEKEFVPEEEPFPSKGRCLNLILSVSLVVCLMQLLILLALTISWKIKRTSSDVKREQSVCQPCPSLKTAFSKTYSEGCSVQDTICCCKASLVINTTVKMSAKSHFQHYKLRGTASVFGSGCSTQTKGTGKVAGIDYESLTKETREKDLIYWDRSNQCILERIRYTNGRFTISEPGLYYVFSQIKYEHDPESAADIHSRQRHALLRYSLRTREQKLHESFRTYAELHSPENNGTSYIGAVFRLEINDEIMIKSSHTHRLSGNDRENFFALYRI